MSTEPEIRGQRSVIGISFFEPAGSHVRAAPKEKKMKRTISLWLGLLAFALLPVLAQAPATPTGHTGKIHGHITGPEGVTRASGSVSLSTDGGHTNQFTFQVTSTGDYEGTATSGTYTVVYRAPDTPPDKIVDSFENVKVVTGQDVLQDIDMSRKEFVDKLPADQKKQLEALKKLNGEAMKANEVIKGLNADLRVVAQDIKDVGAARATAIQTLGATASREDIDAKEVEIRAAKYGEIETMILKDTVAKPDVSVLWAQLGLAQTGLKKYDEAEATYKKALELEAASKKPNSEVQGLANAGLGEIYARTGKASEAAAAYDAAVKINPPQAAYYYRNEASIFFQPESNNPDAQVAAADKAIQAENLFLEQGNPDAQTAIAHKATLAIDYYLKGQGLIGKADVDPKTGRYILPPGCAEAYQKYLDLAPTGQYANDVKGILAQAATKVDLNRKAPKPTR
jgi:tetratricopeptide (TPR) repeat protein